ncbi:MAG: acyl-CoA thioesterase [Mariprofundaceae bacterium]|nr:acyl-CoA thioesterase [Mariprofundaceae bacterium]
MSSRSINTTHVCMDYTVKKDDLNVYGLLHGGRLLTLADEIGFQAAHGFCACDALTVAVHHARFHRPSGLGDTIHMEAKVALTGKSSLWVPIHILGSNKQILMDAIIVYTAVDSMLRPVAISPVGANSPDEKALQQNMKVLKDKISRESLVKAY